MTQGAVDSSAAWPASRPVADAAAQTEAFVPRRDHLPALDGLRGLAVLLVLWSHLPLFPTLKNIVKPGYFGVELFFVLSGFLITRILLYDKQQQRGIGGFYLRRTLRIFPIYYLLLLILLIVAPGEYLAWCGLYLHNFYQAFVDTRDPMGHGWSLAVEEHFYLLWPWVVMLLARARAMKVVIGLLAGTVGFAAVVTLFDGAAIGGHSFQAWRIIYVTTPVRAGSLALGALFAFIEPQLRRSPAEARGLAMRLLIPAMLICLFSGIFLSRVWHEKTWIPFSKFVGYAMLAGGVFLATLSLHGSTARVARYLQSAPLRFVGRISYGLYLYHFPIYLALGQTHRDDTAAHYPSMVLAVVLSFVAAATSYYVLERPILRLKNRFAR